MAVLRTPDERFADLPGYPFSPHYVEVDGLRMHYVDEGAKDAAPVVMLHGEPTWSYLYRKMIPVIVAAGYRALAPDLIGFGRSDKLSEREDYSYQKHVDWVTNWLTALDLNNITLVCQDWGGLIGLRVAAENPDRFARIVAANTALPIGAPISEGFANWRQFSQTLSDERMGGWLIDRSCGGTLSPEEIAAYNAPFPDGTYLAGARQFPLLVPITPDDPAVSANLKAWEVLKQWHKPFLCAFSDGDVVLGEQYKPFLENIPGTKGQPHTTIKGAGHFLQEQKGEELAQVVVNFIRV